MTPKITTIKLEEEQQINLIKIAKGLGYTSKFRTEATGNLTGLMRAIANGEVCLKRVKCLSERSVEYHADE